MQNQTIEAMCVASSKQYKILFGLIFIFILGMATAYFVASSRNVATENELTNNSNLTQQLEKLNQEIEALSKHHQQSSDYVLAHTVTAESTSQPTDVSNPREYTKEDFTSAIQLQQEKLVEKYKNIQHYNPYEEASSKFEAEPYDEVWADIRADKLRNAFITEESLQNYPVKSIDCRSTYCRVEVFYQQQDDLHSMSEEISKLKMIDGGKMLFIPFSQMLFNEKTRTASLYLTDDISGSIY
jgi:hypothetical protein